MPILDLKCQFLFWHPPCPWSPQTLIDFPVTYFHVFQVSLGSDLSVPASLTHSAVVISFWSRGGARVVWSVKAGEQWACWRQYLLLGFWEGCYWDCGGWVGWQGGAQEGGGIRFRFRNNSVSDSMAWVRCASGNVCICISQKKNIFHMKDTTGNLLMAK